MNKYQVTWHYGWEAAHPRDIIVEEIVEAETIDAVNYINILTKEEQQCFADDIKYCPRVIDCDNPDHHIIDYGSASKFITIESIK